MLRHAPYPPQGSRVSPSRLINNANVFNGAALRTVTTSTSSAASTRGSTSPALSIIPSPPAPTTTKVKVYWTPQLDELLRNIAIPLLEQGQESKETWRTIMAQFRRTTTINASDKQIRERWQHHANPNTESSPFSCQQSCHILCEVLCIGTAWAEIAKTDEVEGYSANAIKNHFNTNLKIHYEALIVQHELTEVKASRSRLSNQENRSNNGNPTRRQLSAEVLQDIEARMYDLHKNGKTGKPSKHILRITEAAGLPSSDGSVSPASTGNPSQGSQTDDINTPLPATISKMSLLAILAPLPSEDATQDATQAAHPMQINRSNVLPWPSTTLPSTLSWFSIPQPVEPPFAPAASSFDVPQPVEPPFAPAASSFDVPQPVEPPFAPAASSFDVFFPTQPSRTGAPGRFRNSLPTLPDRPRVGIPICYVRTGAHSDAGMQD
ncbi:hypothetical protein CBS101457_003585 [Exobasidium rhododendri]|nr:hypothetical protein CBS101457_003585 [Exobasidium rhododendri]